MTPQERIFFNALLLLANDPDSFLSSNQSRVELIKEDFALNPQTDLDGLAEASFPGYPVGGGTVGTMILGQSPVTNQPTLIFQPADGGLIFETNGTANETIYGYRMRNSESNLTFGGGKLAEPVLLDHSNQTFIVPPPVVELAFNGMF